MSTSRREPTEAEVRSALRRYAFAARPAVPGRTMGRRSSVVENGSAAGGAIYSESGAAELRTEITRSTTVTCASVSVLNRCVNFCGRTITASLPRIVPNAVLFAIGTIVTDPSVDLRPIRFTVQCDCRGASRPGHWDMGTRGQIRTTRTPGVKPQAGIGRPGRGEDKTYNDDTRECAFLNAVS